jgi:NADH dehydrogenase
VVVVGGGPTGVESAGALSELIRLVLTRDFPRLDVKDVRVILLEATDRMLADFPERLREYAGETLWRKHVEVRYGARVVDFDGERVQLQGGELIPARTLLWAAGVRAAPLADRLGVPQGGLGRLRVRPTLQLEGHDDVFAIGDAACLEVGGRALPMLAPVARQQGEHAAANLLRSLAGEPLLPFRYRDPGSLATIGRSAAVARLGRLRFRGRLAWLVWVVFHIWVLIGFRNRLVVLVNWAWDYFLYDRAVRLISRPEGAGPG